MLPELNRHMEEEEIERYSMGVLSAEEVARAEEHLLVCETCQALVEKEDTFTRAIRKAGARWDREEKTSVAPFWRRPVPMLALAAAVLLLVFAGIRFVPAGASPIAVALEAARGDNNLATAPAGKPLILRLNASTLQPAPTHRVEVVDRSGAEIWEGTANLREARLAVPVPGMTAGVYFVRVYSGDGELLREYGLEVRE